MWTYGTPLPMFYRVDTRCPIILDVRKLLRQYSSGVYNYRNTKRKLCNAVPSNDWGTVLDAIGTMLDFKTCTHGGQYEHDDNLKEFDGDWYEQDTYDELFTDCSRCGNAVSVDDTCNVNDEQWCQRCTDRHTFSCQRCDETFSNDCNSSNVDGDTWCEYCTENHAYYWESDNECHAEPEEEESDKDLHDYSYKPRPNFHGESGPFYGLEIEMECAGNGGAHDFSDTSLYYYKQDGSLDDGAEMVTHPFSYTYWQDSGREQVKSALKGHSRLGAKSYDTNTCGLHIHVSKSALPMVVTSKLLRFVADNVGLVQLLSRRKPGGLDQWASPRLDVSSAVIAKGLGSQARYKAVNVTGGNTVEFRLFRGTLNIDGVDLCLEIVRAFIAFCETHSYGQLKEQEFCTFVKGHKKEYPRLYSFLQEKGRIPKPVTRSTNTCTNLVEV